MTVLINNTFLSQLRRKKLEVILKIRNANASIFVIMFTSVLMLVIDYRLSLIREKFVTQTILDWSSFLFPSFKIRHSFRLDPTVSFLSCPASFSCRLARSLYSNYSVSHHSPFPLSLHFIFSLLSQLFSFVVNMINKNRNINWTSSNERCRLLNHFFPKTKNRSAINNFTLRAAGNGEGMDYSRKY